MKHRILDLLQNGNFPVPSTTPVKLLQGDGATGPGQGYAKFGYGHTVPADAATGWAISAIFLDTDSAAVYINEGTTNSALFKKIGTAGTGGAAAVGILDTGAFTATTTVEAALAEIYQWLFTIQAFLNIPLGGGILAAGTPMAAWANNAGASAPGITLANSKAMGLRWNNQAGQTEVWYQVPLPKDLDDTANIVLHALVSKTGATSGDATTLTVTAFFQTAAALHDADTDRGGASSAIVGTLTAKTVSEVTLTIAASAVPPAPAVLTLSVKPTDGLLGTDDFILHGMWIEYKRKLLTS